MSDDFSVSASALRESGQGNVTSQIQFGLLSIGIWGIVKNYILRSFMICISLQ